MSPLSGVKILDFSRVLAGPSASQTLGDLGADVVKVESPAGDDTRKWGARVGDMESTYYLSVNRCKRGVCIDLSKPEGARAAADLADKADVVIENFKLGGAARFGLDYPTLAARNPRLIYCSISGYGRQSPFNQRLGYDLVAQAETGLMAINGAADGAPMKLGVAAVDLMTGMIAAQAILAAMIARQTTGAGQYIDLALFDCGLSLLSFMGAATLWSGENPVRYGNGHPDIAPYGLFDCADGAVVIAVGNDAQFRKLALETLEDPELADDSRFQKNRDRVAHRRRLHQRMGASLMNFSRAQLTERMAKAGVPGGQVADVLEALHSPQAAARGMVARCDHPQAGSVELLASPIKMSATPVRAPSSPPSLGEHTDEVFRDWLGEAAGIPALRAIGAVK